MTTQVLLGVDVGTTDSKVLATTRSGTEVCLMSAPTPWDSRPGGLVQTDAETLADTVIALMDRAAGAAVDRLGAVDVAAIAVTGMAEIGVLVDEAGRPTHPAIAWFDPRGASEIAATPGDFRREFPRRTGLPVSALASIAKLLWLREHGVAVVGRRWLNLPEFLVHRLGGERAAELSLASRTGLIDQDGPGLWPDALDVLGADESLVPPRVCAGTPLGRVAAGRAPTSLAGAVLTVAGHDHPVAAVGCGVTGTDELFNSFGTADALVRSAALMPSRDVRARLAESGINAIAHVLAGRTVLIGGTRGGLILRRTLELLGAADPRRRAELDAAAAAEFDAAATADAGAAAAAGSGRTGDATGGVLVSGAANDDGTLRIAVDGDGVGPAALWRAALDHGAREADRLLAGMAEFAGPVRRTVVAGGWIRMASVRAAKAAALPGVEFSQRPQAGAFGAAVFAGHAAAVADAMSLAGDHGAVALATPSGPTDAFVAAFVGESGPAAEHPARPGSGSRPAPGGTTPAGAERGTDPATRTTTELEIPA